MLFSEVHWIFALQYGPCFGYLYFCDLATLDELWPDGIWKAMCTKPLRQDFINSLYLHVVHGFVNRWQPSGKSFPPRTTQLCPHVLTAILLSHTDFPRLFLVQNANTVCYGHPPYGHAMRSQDEIGVCTSQLTIWRRFRGAPNLDAT